MTNQKVKNHFNKMMKLNSELMELQDLNEIEVRYQSVMGMVQTLIMDKRLISLSNLITTANPEYGKQFE
jgi:hypothetical protein